jgi:hypothetical protein
MPVHVAIEYAAEVVGFASALALTSQPWRMVRDLRKAQDWREQAERLRADGSGSEAANLLTAAEGLERSVGRWDLFDSRVVKYGGVALALSFALKLLALHLAPPH